MKCRICQKEMDLIEILKGKEQNVTILYKKPFQGERTDVELYRCPFCTHMQIEYVVPDDYYEDYSVIEEPKFESEHGRCSLYALSY